VIEVLVVSRLLKIVGVHVDMGKRAKPGDVAEVQAPAGRLINLQYWGRIRSMATRSSSP